jgi:hypothetical protein
MHTYVDVIKPICVVNGLRLAPLNAPNLVDASPSFQLRFKTDPVYKIFVLSHYHIMNKVQKLTNPDKTSCF